MVSEMKRIFEIAKDHNVDITIKFNDLPIGPCYSIRLVRGCLRKDIHINPEILDKELDDLVLYDILCAIEELDKYFEKEKENEEH